MTKLTMAQFSVNANSLVFIHKVSSGYIFTGRTRTGVRLVASSGLKTNQLSGQMGTRDVDVLQSFLS